MHYAVCWLDDNRKICGWTIHVDAESAVTLTSEMLNIKGVHSRASNVYEVEIHKDDFEEDMFMAVLSTGYAYFDEPNPLWMRGSSSITSKCYVR